MEMQQHLSFSMFVELKTFHKAYTSLINQTAWYHFSQSEQFYCKFMLPAKNETYSSLHVKCPIFSQQIFIKVSSIKFQYNPSSGSHADTCR